MHNSHRIAILPSVIGLLAALIAFVGPFGNTGVDGTPGAGLALAGAFAATLMLGILATRSLPRVWFVTLSVLAAVAALLTVLAAFFLMQTVLAVAMAATFLAVVSAAFTRGHTVQ